MVRPPCTLCGCSVSTCVGNWHLPGAGSLWCVVVRPAAHMLTVLYPQEAFFKIAQHAKQNIGWQLPRCLPISPLCWFGVFALQRFLVFDDARRIEVGVALEHEYVAHCRSTPPPVSPTRILIVLLRKFTRSLTLLYAPPFPTRMMSPLQIRQPRALRPRCVQRCIPINGVTPRSPRLTDGAP